MLRGDPGGAVIPAMDDTGPASYMLGIDGLALGSEAAAAARGFVVVASPQEADVTVLRAVRAPAAGESGGRGGRGATPLALPELLEDLLAEILPPALAGAA